MKKDKDTKKDKNNTKEKLTKPGEINGKIEVADTRERRDGPGGN